MPELHGLDPRMHSSFLLFFQIPYNVRLIKIIFQFSSEYNSQKNTPMIFLKLFPSKKNYLPHQKYCVASFEAGKEWSMSGIP